MNRMSIQEAKQTDMVDYLAAMRYQPSKIRGADYWYLSPLRTEKTPSFKINCKANIWYDHGTGQGGNFIDFGVLYHKCSVSDFLVHVKDFSSRLKPSFRQLDKQDKVFFSPADEKKEIDKGKILIINERPISANSLLAYLEGRRIPLNIASLYCKEVDFLLYEKQHTAIGFRNEAGGCELRNDYFKGSSSPKASLFINNQASRVAVFEGFFNFLSHQAIHAGKSISPDNFLILNSLAFFQKQRNIMEQHDQINLYLDRDMAGMNCTEEALKFSAKYQDQSVLYNSHKDLNEWLVQNKERESLSIKSTRKQIVKQIKMKRYDRF